jgi:translocation and assembly module TamA
MFPYLRINFLLILLIFCHNIYGNQYVAKITIHGIKGELRKNVLASISIEQEKTHPRLSPGQIRRLHKKAPEEIKRALQAFGYYKVKVEGELIKPSHKVDFEAYEQVYLFKAKYHINLGPALKLKLVKITINGEAKKDSVFKKVLANLPLKPGDTLIHANYEKAKSILHNLAEERGYFDAVLTEHKILIDEQAYTASIILSFDSKKRYRFGEVSFTKGLFDESLLRRFLTFKKGDFYTSRALLALKNALDGSLYFKEVTVNIPNASNRSQDNLYLPVNVKLKLRKRNKYGIGIGYGTDTGVRGSLEWEQRYINSYGHSFSVRTELSQVRKSATARYYIPRGLNVKKYLTITAGYKDESTDTSESELLKLAINYHQPIKLFGSQIDQVLSLEYQDEKYTVGSDSGHARLLMPHLSLSYLKTDNPIYTRRGHKIQWDTRGALANVGSNTSFWQTSLSATFIYPIFKRGRIIARGDSGYSDVSLVDGDFHELPPSIRFFAGGDQSVRGYDYQELGPKNENGQVIGGKYLLVGSLEYEYRILEKWSLAAFYDIGNAFNGTSEPLKEGVGVGVRWHTPIGLIRVDVAAALSKPDHPLRLHIRIGPDL